MSDPVTNAEVEDVLSSIRRLVSEDKRPVQAPRSEARSDRLVLTPSLRVSDETSDDAELDTVQDTATSSTQTMDAVDNTVSEPPVEVAIGSLLTDDVAIDVYEDEKADWEGADVSDLAEYDEDEMLDEPGRGDPAHDYSDDPYRFDDDDNTDGEDDDEVVLTGLASEAYSVDDGSSDADEPASDAAEDPEITATISGDTVEEPEEAEQEAFSQDEGKAATLTAKITALETAIGQIADTWEPDEAGDGDYAGTEPQAMAWEDDKPENTAAASQSDEKVTPHQSDAETMFEPDADDTTEFTSSAPEAETVAAAASEPSQDRLDIDGDAQLIDEEALRDLVSDIVRAELQGALGERITRNVRKLVRREIHRALTAQDLE